MIGKWIVIWQSIEAFSPPPRGHKMTPRSDERQYEFDDQKAAVGFVMEKLNPDERFSAVLISADDPNARFAFDDIKRMHAKYQSEK